MTRDYAPIAFFVYNRPAHARNALDSLKACPEAALSTLFVYCDGARPGDDPEAVTETRRVIRAATASGFAKVIIVEQTQNKGLANSIIGGVSDLCNRFGRVIVIEDDLILSPYFLGFMNDALIRYADTSNILQIAGYQFGGVPVDHPEDALFLPLTTSWGWATWQRAWRYFDADMAGRFWLWLNPWRRRRFNLFGAVNYYDMLRRQRAGLIDSWAIRWYLSVFRRDGLVVFPRSSLVRNGGLDGSGRHCGIADDEKQPDFMDQPIRRWPQKIAVSPLYQQVIAAIRAAGTV